MLDNPEILAQIADDMGLGLPQVEICRAYGITEGALSKWKKHPKFLKILADSRLRHLRPPLESMKERQPTEYIQRHPVTRELWSPPKTVNENTGSVEIVIRDCAKENEQKK